MTKLEKLELEIQKAKDNYINAVIQSDQLSTQRKISLIEVYLNVAPYILRMPFLEAEEEVKEITKGHSSFHTHIRRNDILNTWLEGYEYRMSVISMSEFCDYLEEEASEEFLAYKIHIRIFDGNTAGAKEIVNTILEKVMTKEEIYKEVLNYMLTKQVGAFNFDW